MTFERPFTPGRFLHGPFMCAQCYLVVVCNPAGHSNRLTFNETQSKYLKCNLSIRDIEDNMALLVKHVCFYFFCHEIV